MPYVNLPSGESISAIPKYIDQLLPLWRHPIGYIDRLIVGEFSAGRQVLEYLHTCGQKENGDSLEEMKCNICDFHQVKNLLPNGIHLQDLIPTIICSVDTAYELDRILHIFEENRQQIKIELLVGDSAEDLKTFQYFLEDKLCELKLEIPPTCSLIHRLYEIDYSEIQKKHKTPRNRRKQQLPVEFRNLLKKSQPDIYKNMLGNEYYSARVFSSMIQMLFEQWQRSLGFHLDPSSMEKTEVNLAAIVDQWSAYSILNQIPTPPFPMKSFDLLEKQGTMEFHWTKKYLPFSFLSPWLQQLGQLSDQIEHAISSLRIICKYDAWLIENEIYEARNDKLILGCNDVDFAFRQQNIPNLFYFLHHIPHIAFYWQFTNHPDEEDVRIRNIEQKMHRIVHLR